jgi:hypothetical protein
LPLIFLLDRAWPRYGIGALVAIALAGGWLSSIRGTSGLPLLLAAAAVLLLRRYRWWLAAPTLALLVVAYISTGTFVIDAIREHRNERIGIYTLDRGQPTSHVLWHSAYIGLGYLPNSYGIRYKDGFAIARVQREAPGTPYLSPRYEAVIRKAFLNIAEHHPAMVAKQYAAKTLVTVADTFLYIWPALLLFPAMLLTGPDRRSWRRALLLLLLAVIVAFLQPVVAIPMRVYETGLDGAIGLTSIMAVCWMLERVEAAARRSGGLRSGLAALVGEWTDARATRGALWRSARVGTIALVAMLVLVVSGHFVRRSAERWQGAASGVLIDELSTSPDSDTYA